MAWITSSTALQCRLVGVINWEPALSDTAIGRDLAKSVFHRRGVAAAGHVVHKRYIRCHGLLAFFTALPSCLVGMEACSGAHQILKRPKRRVAVESQDAGEDDFQQPAADRFFGQAGTCHGSSSWITGTGWCREAESPCCSFPAGLSAAGGQTPLLERGSGESFRTGCDARRKCRDCGNSWGGAL